MEEVKAEPITTKILDRTRIKEKDTDDHYAYEINYLNCEGKMVKTFHYIKKRKNVKNEKNTKFTRFPDEEKFKIIHEWKTQHKNFETLIKKYDISYLLLRKIKMYCIEQLAKNPKKYLSLSNNAPSTENGQKEGEEYTESNHTFYKKQYHVDICRAAYCRKPHAYKQLGKNFIQCEKTFDNIPGCKLLTQSMITKQYGRNFDSVEEFENHCRDNNIDLSGYVYCINLV